MTTNSTNSKFLHRDGASLYYLANGSGGSFLTPPGHATQKFHVIEKRGGHEVGFYSLESDLLPARVTRETSKLLKQMPGTVTEEFIQEVYTYFAHCYSKDGTNRNVSESVTYGAFWDNAELEKDENPAHSLAYLCIKQYDPSHTPRLDLMSR